MSASVRVTRLRVSRIAGHIHDRIRVIGDPDGFENQLTNPQEVRGLRVSLPFAPDLHTDKSFWDMAAEKSLTIPLANARKASSASVPLRYRAQLNAPAETPRLEAHIHPFGVVAMATVDLTWPDPVAIEDLPKRVSEIESQEVEVNVADGTRRTTFDQVAVAACEEVVKRLTDDGVGNSWPAQEHRLVTIVSGNYEDWPEEMRDLPAPLCKALHFLSAGGQIISNPANAFVPQWAGSQQYVWPVNSLIYMLDSGTTVMASDDGGWAPRSESNADRHRRHLLTLSYLIALGGLVRVYANGDTDSTYFEAWSRGAADRLARLFGPAGCYRQWGLIPQAFLSRTGASEDIEKLLEKPLAPSTSFQVAQW